MHLFNKILCLIGTWQVERYISNFGKASGTAFFSQEEENLIFYREDVLLINRIKSFREYYYSFNPLNQETQQLFNDKRIFSTLHFNEISQTATGEHICGQDYYYATYSLIGENQFITEYKITGPHKNSRITTKYFRMNKIKSQALQNSCYKIIKKTKYIT